MDREIEVGREVIIKEAENLHKLAHSLDKHFVAAIKLINNTTNRVIVTGMGKSGHIARKIAATFASTGKTSFFVHPAEAAHGDLGMINQDDCVLAISNSGETAELFSILEYCKRYGVPVIGMTKNKSSTLAQYSDIVLQIPEHEEACPLGLAPTTSTTMCLALGDALAVAVYKEEFDHERFAVFHPGGKLGSKLLKVAHIMHTGDEMPVIDITDNIGNAILTMTRKALGCVGVIEDDKLVGIITDGDLRRHIHDIPIKSSVGEIMTRNPKTVPPTILASEALKFMNDNKISSIFVINEDRPLGVIHLHDCLRAKVS